ncbi:hypothetical protein BJ912DRAFT_662752 [Pholiota molesta]|nr:hypothetical protein BJ912DRAFT_662752 [Pholiota molesta]
MSCDGTTGMTGLCSPHCDLPMIMVCCQHTSSIRGHTSFRRIRNISFNIAQNTHALRILLLPLSCVMIVTSLCALLQHSGISGGVSKLHRLKYHIETLRMFPPSFYAFLRYFDPRELDDARRYILSRRFGLNLKWDVSFLIVIFPFEIYGTEKNESPRIGIAMGASGYLERKTQERCLAPEVLLLTAPN